MTITCDTELSEILQSSTICDAIYSMNTKAQSVIESRAGAMASCLKTGGGLGEDQIVDNVPVFFNSGKEIMDKYVTMSETVANFATNVCQKAVDKELEELGLLSDAVQRKIAELDAAIESAQQAVEDSLKQGSQFAMVSPEVELARLIEERQRYADKLDAIGARIKTLDPSAEIAVAPPLPDYTGGSGETEEDDGAGEETETSEEEPAKPNCQIPTEGRTTEEMYTDSRNIEREVETEWNYLRESRGGVEYSLAVLEQQYKDGYISEETYTRLSGEYNARIEYLDREIASRENAMDALSDINGKKWNDTNAAEQAARVNELTGAMTPIEQVMADNQLAGMSQNRKDAIYTNPYSEGFQNSTGYGELSSITNTTRAAAFEVAQNRGTATETSPGSGVYVYSVGEYFYTMPDNAYSTVIGVYGSSDYQTASYTHALISSAGDTVYDSNTGQYYSWGEWVAAHPEDNN